jgi:hypothetical protein
MGNARQLSPVVEEARLEAVASGLAPVSPGWFVVNARDAALVNNDYFGGVCIFESDDFVLRGRPDLDEYVKPAAGFTLRVVSPGRPAGLYHAETVQEDFLVRFRPCGMGMLALRPRQSTRANRPRSGDARSVHVHRGGLCDLFGGYDACFAER